MTKVGIVDTMFSRVNMGEIAMEELKKNYPAVEIVRTTVPGIKDLAVECKKLLEGHASGKSQNLKPETGNRLLAAHCDAVLALGMVGGAPIDTQCGHEASLGIQQAKLMTNKHIIEVFVHENEAWSAEEFIEICENRIRKHAHNAVLIVERPEELVKNAGMGIRQGRKDEGPADPEEEIHIAIVASRFNEEITEKMTDKALEVAEEEGIKAIVANIPGVYDMPLVVKKLLMDKKINAVVALGAAVKGETAHDEVIVKDTAKRLGELSLEFNKPVTLGIIGHDADWSMAEKRAEEYAERALKSALELVKTLRG